MPRPPSRSPKAASPLRRFATARDGGVAVTVALVTPVLIGMAALALDLGRAWSTQTELQSAADAAALAGASQLDNEAGACIRAKNAASNELVSNLQTFGGGTREVGIDPEEDILLYVSLDDRTDLSDDPNCGLTANYIEVRVEPRTVSFFFAPVVAAFTGSQDGLTEANPRGRAVARMGQAICRVTPMFVCQPGDDFEPGQGLRFREQGPGSSGNFGLIALDGNMQNPAIVEALAAINPDIERVQCFGADEALQTKTGQVAGPIQTALNVRFDIYANGGFVSKDDPNYAPSANPVKGMVREGNRCDLHNDKGWHLPDVSYPGPDLLDEDGNPVDPANIGAMGFPRDDCHYTDSCGLSNDDLGDGNWDFQTYMAVNHPMAVWPTGWSATAPSRFEVFTWELAEATLASDLPQGGPQCSSHAESPDTFNGREEALEDRRVITVAGVDCDGLSGQSEVTPKAWYRILLTQPVGDPDQPNKPFDLYAEVIDKPAQDPVVQTDVVRNVLQLVE